MVPKRLAPVQGNLPLDGGAFTKVLDNQIATHVVTGVTWGANCVAAFEERFSTYAEREKLEGKLKGVMRMGAAKFSGSIGMKSDEEIQAYTKSTHVIYKISNHIHILLLNICVIYIIQAYTASISVQLHGDVVPFGNGTLPTTPDEALDIYIYIYIHIHIYIYINIF